MIRSPLKSVLTRWPNPLRSLIYVGILLPGLLWSAAQQSGVHGHDWGVLPRSWRSAVIPMPAGAIGPIEISAALYGPLAMGGIELVVVDLEQAGRQEGSLASRL